MSDSGPDQTNLGIPGIDNVVEIGRSASHTTFRVRDIATGRTVVVKLLNAGRDWPGLEQRFESEQTSLAQLVGHPNIVPVHGHGWTETGMPYVVSGEETGGSIGDRLRGPTPMTGPDILALGVRLAGALESLHRAGVVHGDLRPDDMMLTPDGEPLRRTSVWSRSYVPTPPASPIRRISRTSRPNCWTVARESLSPTSTRSRICLVHVARRRSRLRPPGGHVGGPGHQAHRIDPLPDLTAKSVPPSVAEVVAKAMSKAPADRYKSAQDFGRALQQSQVALGLPMTDMTLLGSAAAAASTSAWEGTHDIRAGAAVAGGAAAGGLPAPRPWAVRSAHQADRRPDPAGPGTGRCAGQVADAVVHRAWDRGRGHHRRHHLLRDSRRRFEGQRRGERFDVSTRRSKSQHRSVE